MAAPDPLRLRQLLDEVEAELKQIALWTPAPPPPAAFDSDLPFFTDTMDFEQWLQWVFLTRFRALLDGGHALPTQCSVAPMAEEAFRMYQADTLQLIRLLSACDDLFTG